VAQERSQLTQHRSESKHIAAVVSLKHPTGRQVGDSSAANYSSRLSRFDTFTIGAKHLCPQTYHFLNENTTK
jgi:hypothetical protein